LARDSHRGTEGTKAQREGRIFYHESPRNFVGKTLTGTDGGRVEEVLAGARVGKDSCGGRKERRGIVAEFTQRR